MTGLLASVPMGTVGICIHATTSDNMLLLSLLVCYILLSFLSIDHRNVTLQAHKEIIYNEKRMFLNPPPPLLCPVVPDST